MQITVCGGGNAAHISAGILGARKEHQVNVYASFGDEAQRWQKGVAGGGITVTSPAGSTVGHPRKISSDPAEVIPGSQLVLLALPAFAHESILREIAPFLEEGALVGALAARGCFDLCARDVLKGKVDKVTIFGLQTLPWACRIKDYGREATILGSKASVDLATRPTEQSLKTASFLGDQLGVPMEPIGNFLSLTLAGTGQIIHPGVMYGQFHDWDGHPFEEAPPFYQGIDETTADILQDLSDEIQALRFDLEARFPGIDLSAVRPLDEWLYRSYADDITDPSSLQSSFVTNQSYAGLTVPMRSKNGGLVPDFQARYLSEDVPNALLATRGIAELADVPTLSMDKVITWAQDRLGKQYLVDRKLHGRDVKDSRAPQRYGFLKLEGLLKAMNLKVT
jgi:hypothetical protein